MKCYIHSRSMRFGVHISDQDGSLLYVRPHNLGDLGWVEIVLCRWRWWPNGPRDSEWIRSYHKLDYTRCVSLTYVFQRASVIAKWLQSVAKLAQFTYNDYSTISQNWHPFTSTSHLFMILLYHRVETIPTDITALACLLITVNEIVKKKKNKYRLVI